MFDSIVSFFRLKKPLHHFNKNFRNGYKNKWINDIKNYNP
jgi:hypothetical protein